MAHPKYFKLQKGQRLQASIQNQNMEQVLKSDT